MFRRMKAKVARKIAWFIYYRIASKLPASYNTKSKIPKRLRAWCGKYLLERCGKDVNIEKNVELRWGGEGDPLPQSTERLIGGKHDS